MNTKEAFKMVINNRDCHKKTGLSYSEISIYRKWCDGKSNLKPSIEKMQMTLQKYGMAKVVEEQWIFND